jgi:DNA-binding transcriptional ArsR family regulator
MPNEEIESTDHDLELLTSMFRLLSDTTRLNILILLTDGERNVSSLCDELKLPQPTVSHHLGLLRMNNVIGNRRAGKQVFYGLNGKVDSASALLAIDMHKYDLAIHRKVNTSSSPVA